MLSNQTIIKKSEEETAATRNSYTITAEALRNPPIPLSSIPESKSQIASDRGKTKSSNIVDLYHSLFNNFTAEANEEPRYIPKYYVYPRIFAHEGFLDKSPQIHRAIEFSISPKLRNKLYVPPAEAKVGEFLFSDGFGPCIGVVAELKDGRCAIYHAYDPHRQALGFQDFVRGVKGQLNKIFIFEKTGNFNHKMNAPILALELTECLEFEVERIKVPNYSAIVADTINKRIVLGQIILNLEPSDDHAFKCKGNSRMLINLNKPISVDESLLDICDENLTQYKIQPRLLELLGIDIKEQEGSRSNMLPRP